MKSGAEKTGQISEGIPPSRHSLYAPYRSGLKSVYAVVIKKLKLPFLMRICIDISKRVGLHDRRH